jgi:hypothetical protein
LPQDRAPRTVLKSTGDGAPTCIRNATLTWLNRSVSLAAQENRSTNEVSRLVNPPFLILNP